MLHTRFNKRWALALLVYVVFFGVVVFVNFPRGEFLTGWDAVHPEFNFGLNLQRNLQAVWQDNYGSGALVGHGFGALLPHTLLTWLLSFALPLWAVRPAFILLTYFLGGLGMLIFCGEVLGRLFGKKENITTYVPWASLAAALYYGLNLGTVQQFYLPLEAFVVQFAFLPWFFWVAWRYLEKPSRKVLFWLAVVVFWGSVQGFIPALWLALVLVLAVVGVGWLVLSTQRQRAIKAWLGLGLVFFLVQAYWLLPFGYYVVANQGDFLSAYNNLITTADFVAKSEAYGTLGDTALLKSFYLEGEQPEGLVFQPWLTHYNGWIEFIGWLLFGLVLVGWVYISWQSRVKTYRLMGVAALVVFGFLASRTPPFSWYMQFLYQHSDLFAQVFRTAFTKFGVLMAFFYALFLGVGLLTVIRALGLKFGHRLGWGGVGLVVVMVGIIGWPVLRGNLFNQQLKTDIPDAYFDLMEFMDVQDNGRIAELPIECAEGWFTRPWGYYGSGFMWYGISQPYMSRTFDVWSRYNENFYFETRYALRQSGYEGLDEVLDKYQVTYVYIDQNLSHCLSQHGVDYQSRLTAYFEDSSAYDLVFESSEAVDYPLVVFKRVGVRAEVMAPPELAIVPAQTTAAMSKDWLFAEYGAYLEAGEMGEIAYPFLAMESQNLLRQAGLLTVQESELELKLRPTINGTLRLPAYANSERVLPVRVTLKQVGGTVYQGFLHLLGPMVELDGRVIYEMPMIDLGELQVRDREALNLSMDNIALVRVGDDFVGSLFMNEINNLIAREGNESLIWWRSTDVPELRGLASERLIHGLEKGSELKVSVPKVLDEGRYGNYIPADNLSLPVDCSATGTDGVNRFEKSTLEQQPLLRMISKGDSQCLRVAFEEARPADGYVVLVRGENISGLAPAYTLSNWRGIVYAGGVGLNLERKQPLVMVVPPVFERDLAYTLEIKNTSYGDRETINDIKSVEYWFLPYRFLSQIQVITDTTNTSGGFGEMLDGNQIQTSNNKSQNELKINSFRKLGIGRYEVRTTGSGWMALGQGFDGGWVAYQLQGTRNKLQEIMPWWFGERLEQVKVNGWQNGFILPDPGSMIQDSREIAIIYWPQYLEWLGLLLVAGTFGFLGFKVLKYRQK